MANLSEKEQENALNEVRILASIKSPHIIGYKQAFVESNSLWYTQNNTQHRHGVLRRRRPLPKDSPASKGGECVRRGQCLAHANSHHSGPQEAALSQHPPPRPQSRITSIQSANVFLSRDGTAKLGDMNVSKIAKNGLLYTQTGTPYYASPEVWKDKPYDSKSDIWSLGCAIYEMTTLKPPFRA